MYSTLESAPMATAVAPLRGRVARGGVLVLGGGFAGAYVARQLGRNGATIVNPTNFMLYTPLLPEAAAGNIEPRHVVVPLRTMCPHADLVLGCAVALDPERRVVEVQSEAGRIAISYEQLVIALGSVTRTPPVPGLREHALGLKDLGDAIRLRNHVLRQIELADAAPHTAARRLTFVVAGAGFSGVEAIAEVSGDGRGGAAPPPAPGPRQAALGAGRRRAAHPGPDARRPGALRRAHARQARSRDRHADAPGLRRRRGRRTLRRAPDRDRDRRVDRRRGRQPAGDRARPAGRRPRPRRGRRDAARRRAERIWALGDCAAVPNLATPGVTDPPTCQHALRQARRLSKNLRGKAKPYRFRSLGHMATLGRRHGIAVVAGLRLRGIAGWAFARGYHVLQLPFASRRARVVADWTAAAVFRRDLAELSMPATAAQEA